ncbi:MAG: RNA-binding S4 domain-containing protein, partial [Burkholderiales bacterium]
DLAYLSDSVASSWQRKMSIGEIVKVRLDKWLWAARFFKTRALAATAIETGKVEVNGERAKRAKQLQIGDSLRIRLGPYQHLVTVRAVSEQRGPAPIAAKLYEETEEGRKAREAMQFQMKAAQSASGYTPGRPTKKDRREIEKVRRKGMD